MRDFILQKLGIININCLLNMYAEIHLQVLSLITNDNLSLCAA